MRLHYSLFVSAGSFAEASRGTEYYVVRGRVSVGFVLQVLPARMSYSRLSCLRLSVVCEAHVGKSDKERKGSCYILALGEQAAVFTAVKTRCGALGAVLANA